MALLIDVPAVHHRPAGVVLVAGHDRLTYLHSLLSQHLEGAAAGTVADFLYLDAKGNAQAVGRAVVRSGDVLLVAPPDVAANLADALARFTFLLDAKATDVSDEWALASVRGPVEVPGARPDPMTAAPQGAGIVIRDRSGGVDLLGPPEWVRERVADLGLDEAGDDAFQAWRILAAEPAWQREIIPGRRPQELGLLPTHVHLRKGCYPGQESIAKVYNLGRPRRALAVVALDAAHAPGDRVAVDGKTAEVTSVAATDNGWVAMALLPLDREGQVAGEVAGGRVLRLVGEGLAQPGA